MTPSVTFNTADGITPTSNPPAIAPITEPNPIGATVLLKADLSVNAPDWHI